MILLDGFLTGLLLQVAIGPVFFYILNLALAGSLLDVLAAIGAAVLVDYLYIILAILGVGKALEKERVKTGLGIAGGIILCLFGWMMIRDPLTSSDGAGFILKSVNPGSSFLSTFLLTISSPLTIVFWTGVFATRGVQKSYSQNELIPFGIGAGLATLVFLGSSISLLRSAAFFIPDDLIRYLNSGVGIILMLYGVIRLGKLIKGRTRNGKFS